MNSQLASSPPSPLAGREESGLAGRSRRGSGPGSGDGSGDGRKRARRRIPGMISVLACLECRRAKTKCDGDKGRVCSRCSNKGLKCTYQPNTKTQKDDILDHLSNERSKTDSLAVANRSLRLIIDIIAHESHVDEVIRRLRANQDVNSISEWLSTKPELRRYIERNKDADLSFVEIVERIEGLYIRPELTAPSANNPAIEWTTVASRPTFIGFLFEKYFTWIHPHHMLFSEAAFLESYINGDELYCSRAMVNAICSLACHLLDRAEIADSVQENADLAQLQNAFGAEARAAIGREESGRITTHQAFAVLFLDRLSSGKAREASGYLRCAADDLEDVKEDIYTQEILDLSRWGIYTLNIAWSAFVCQKPFTSRPPSKHIDFGVRTSAEPPSTKGKEREKDEIAASQRAIIVAEYHAGLMRIVHGIINMYCGTQGMISASRFLDYYSRLKDWRESLPDELVLNEETVQQYPISTLHIVYYTAVTELFWPLLRRFYESEIYTEMQAQVLDHARQGLSVIRISQEQKNCRYYTPLSIYCVVQLCDILAGTSTDAKERVEAADLCLDVLDQNMAGFFKLCGPLQQMFRRMMDEYEVELPLDVEERFGSSDRYGVEEILDAATRLTYKQPTSQIVRWIAPEFESEWPQEWKRHFDPSSATAHSMRLNTVLN